MILFFIIILYQKQATKKTTSFTAKKQKRQSNFQKIELPFYKILLGNQPKTAIITTTIKMNTQTEQFYCEPSCECNTRMDIRARCDPVKSAPSFANCPAKINTTFFLIQNTYDEFKQYEHLCEPGVRQDRNDVIASIAITDKYGLTGDEVDELLELFDEADEDDYKYNCICCDTFVPTSEEDNCRFDGDEEGVICWDCIPEHFCEDCDEYYATEIEPNICGKYICYICEEDRLDAFKEAEQEKAEEKKKLNKAIIARWELLKKEMEGWINELIIFAPEGKSFTDDIVRREGLVKSLNVMLNELGQQVGDEYDDN